MSAFIMQLEGFNDLFNELAVRAESSNRTCDVHYSITRDVLKFLGIDSYAGASEALVNSKALDRVIALFRANVEAVNYRYSHLPEVIENQPEVPLLTRNSYWPKWSPVQLLKHLQCLSYQMSEGEIPETQIYKDLDRLISAIALSIVNHTPEYDKAKWDFEPELTTA